MTSAQPKHFNVGGPCDPLEHYMLPALPRLPIVSNLIQQKEYFVLHAPRQSGKTTFIQALVDNLNEEGSYYALYCDLQNPSDNFDKTNSMHTIISILDDALADSKVDALIKASNDGFWDALKGKLKSEARPLLAYIKALCRTLDKELIIFFDEADSLKEHVLLSFLAQLKAGFITRRYAPFPRSIALIGMRNIRYYKAKTKPGSETIDSASPFNILAESLTLTNFSRAEIHDLYMQHTEACGQIFLDEAVQKAWYWSEGQPWLVNALAREVIQNILFRDYNKDITAEHFDIAADNLMKRRDTHIDSLLDRLSEPRVKRFLDSMIEGSEESAMKGKLGESRESLNNDIQYCVDLGLFKQRKDKELCPANPIYASIMVRSLNEDIEYSLPSEIVGKWMDKSKIDMTGLLKEFQKHWALIAEPYLKGMLFHEKAPHYLLAAFIQRVANGGAIITNEFRTGLNYSDIVVKYAKRHYIIELKIKDNQRSWAKSKAQILKYMDFFQENEGWLVIVDRKSTIAWKEKLTWETETEPSGEIIHVVGC